MTFRSPVITWVFDTSPLIHLDQLGYLPIVPSIVGNVLIPPAVRAELNRGQGRPGTAAHEQTWVGVRNPSKAMITNVQGEFSGGAGEIEALALALELGCGVVIDERRARNYAHQQGLLYTGVLGIVSAVHGRGMASRSITQDLELLDQSGMRLSGNVKRRFLWNAGNHDE